MVLTRSQRARTGITHQSLPQRARRWIKRYRDTDWAHRHRIKDRQPKTKHVSGYTRRT